MKELSFRALVEINNRESKTLFLVTVMLKVTQIFNRFTWRLEAYVALGEIFYDRIIVREAW